VVVVRRKSKERRPPAAVEHVVKVHVVELTYDPRLPLVERNFHVLGLLKQCRSLDLIDAVQVMMDNLHREHSNHAVIFDKLNRKVYFTLCLCSFITQFEL